MRYTGTTKCSKCKKQFDYFCLPYKNKADKTDGGTVVTIPDSELDSTIRQMFFEGVDTDGIPFYATDCPLCKNRHELPKAEAGLIPKYYFE